MSTVIATLAKYEVFLKHERHIKASTLRKVNLSLSYFTELYGITETKDLRAADMSIFYEWLKNKHCKKTQGGEPKPFGSAYLQKIMIHLKTYIKRLSDNACLNKLVPADVPR